MVSKLKFAIQGSTTQQKTLRYLQTKKMLRTSALGKVQKLQKSTLPSVELLILISSLYQNIAGDGAFLPPRAAQPLQDSCTPATLAIGGRALAFTRCDIL